MTTTVEDDFAAFVAARWPDLEALALVVTLDPVLAREVTTDALGRLRADWDAAVAEGVPSSRARRSVADRALRATRPPTGQRPDEAPSVRPTRPPAGSSDDDDREQRSVMDALWPVLARASAMERAVLAAAQVCDLDAGETAQLLDLTVEEVDRHDAALHARFEAAHDTVRAESGQGAAPWLLRHDVDELIDGLLAEQTDPPDPAGLVARRADGVRRRSVLVGAAALVGVGAAGAAGRALTRGPEAAVTAPTTSASPGPTDVAWASVSTWPARGGLAGDVGVQSRIVADTASGSRLVYADDLGDRRVAVAVALGPPSSGTQVRVWQGERGVPGRALEEVDLGFLTIDGVKDVIALSLPQAYGSALVVLARPTVDRGQVSRFVRPTRAGTVEREWLALDVQEGVAVDFSDRGVSPATRVRVGGYDGPPTGTAALWLGSSLRSGTAEEAARDATELVASATGEEVDTIESRVVVDSICDGSILDPYALSATGGDGRVVVVLTTTRDGATLRSVLVADDGRSGTGTADLESVRLVPADQAEAPVLLQISDAGPEVGRFLVVAPGSASAQLLATSPDAYPVSKVTAMKGDTAVVSVINADDASAFRLVLKDADGAETYRGVPPSPTWLFDLFDD